MNWVRTDELGNKTGNARVPGTCCNSGATEMTLIAKIEIEGFRCIRHAVIEPAARPAAPGAAGCSHV